MNWYEILRLILAILKILDLLPKEKKKKAEQEVFKAIAKIVTDDNVA